MDSMCTLSEGNLLRQISSLNEELVEENNKITKALMKVLYSRQSREPATPSNNLLKHMEEQSRELKNYSRSSVKSNKSTKWKKDCAKSEINHGKSQKRCNSCDRTRDGPSKSMKQSEKSRLLAMRSHTSPPGRPLVNCSK